ncbi:MAG: biosynthetic arginine decarboxylase, partial [Gammaproteobacteria bacterium]
IRLYADIVGLGAPLGVIDVGGGLGVDYEGTRSRSFCSVNYSLEEFARTVVRGVWEGCDAAGLSHPRIVTEAGRAMTAHHAVLISDAIDVDRPDDTVPTDPGENAPFVLRDLYTAYREHSGRSPVELYHEATHWLAEARGMYLHGVLDLEQRAQAEQLHVAICQGILPRLRSDAPSDREVLETLNGQLAEKVFCNFSLFQSLPDVWAIDQIFPIVPLRGLDRAPSRSVVIEDLTCDSDGRIDHYAGELGISDVLPLPNKDQGERQVLGFFLVGAYQETLGDIHNLFGDTHSVSVRCQGDGQWTIEDVSEGDSISQVLSQVGYDPGDVIQRIRRKCAADPDGGADQLLESLEATLLRGTYLSR